MNFWIIGTLLLSLISPVFYTKSMLAGKARPHRITRLIVWLASIAGMLGVIHSSNLAGIIFAGIFLVRASYLLVMAFLFGTGGASRLDRYCLAVGVLAILLYATTGSGLLAIAFGILADLIGYVPTFVKIWRRPKSEDPAFFIIEGFASLFAVFAIWQARVDILFPVYFVVCSVTVVSLIYRKHIIQRIDRMSSEPIDLPE
jgi:hypothetical protein